MHFPVLLNTVEWQACGKAGCQMFKGLLLWILEVRTWFSMLFKLKRLSQKIPISLARSFKKEFPDTLLHSLYDRLLVFARSYNVWYSQTVPPQTHRFWRYFHNSHVIKVSHSIVCLLSFPDGHTHIAIYNECMLFYFLQYNSRVGCCHHGHSCWCHQN